MPLQEGPPCPEALLEEEPCPDKTKGGGKEGMEEEGRRKGGVVGLISSSESELFSTLESLKLRELELWLEEVFAEDKESSEIDLLEFWKDCREKWIRSWCSHWGQQ